MFWRRFSNWFRRYRFLQNRIHTLPIVLTKAFEGDEKFGKWMQDCIDRHFLQKPLIPRYGKDLKEQWVSKKQKLIKDIGNLESESETLRIRIKNAQKQLFLALELPPKDK